MYVINLGNRFVNSYLFPCKSGYVLIDTGYPGSFGHFLKALSMHSLSVGDISYVFLTHAHDDHAGFINELMSANSHVKLVLSKEASEGLRRGQNKMEGGSPGLLATVFCRLMVLTKKDGGHRFPPLEGRFVERCIIVTEENKEFLGQKLGGTVYETPGHTECSISLLTEDGILFAGDAAMNNFPSRHRITIWIGDKRAYYKTWKEILRMKPAMICPGHGKSFLPKEIKQNLKNLKRVRLYKGKGM